MSLAEGSVCRAPSSVQIQSACTVDSAACLVDYGGMIRACNGAHWLSSGWADVGGDDAEGNTDEGHNTGEYESGSASVAPALLDENAVDVVMDEGVVEVDDDINGVC